MKRRSCLSILSLALLAACAGEEPADNEAAMENAAVQPGPMLGGADLSAPLQLRPLSGGGWVIDLAPGRIVFTPAGAAPVPFYPVSPRLQGNQAMYPTQTPDGAEVRITLIAGRCGPGNAAPLRADIRIGTRTLQGCASPVPIEQVHRAMYNEALAMPYNAETN